MAARVEQGPPASLGEVGEVVGCNGGDAATTAAVVATAM